MKSTFPTLLEIAILASLSKTPNQYSSPLMDATSALLGHRQILATLHTSLHRLNDKKLLTSTMKKQDGARSCRRYAITAAGRKALASARKSLVRLGK